MESLQEVAPSLPKLPLERGREAATHVAGMYREALRDVEEVLKGRN